LPSRPIDNTTAVSVETVRRKPARDHHHAADQHDAAAGAHQHPPGQKHRPTRRQREHRAADGGHDEHTDHGVARPETVEEKAAGDLHRRKAEEERAGERAQRLRPDREIAHQIEADGDVGGAEKMAGDIGGGQCRNDNQAPAVGQRPLGGLHRMKRRFRLFSYGSACGEPMRARSAAQQAIGPSRLLRASVLPPGSMARARVVRGQKIRRAGRGAPD
jgi:hypothetical protein